MPAPPATPPSRGPRKERGPTSRRRGGRTGDSTSRGSLSRPRRPCLTSEQRLERGDHERRDGAVGIDGRIVSCYRRRDDLEAGRREPRDVAKLASSQPEWSG